MKEINCIICGRHKSEILWRKDGFDYNFCPDCGLVYVNPQPSAEELEYYYNKNYRVNMRRYLGRKKKWSGMIRNIEKYSGRGIILEIGCSYGLFLKAAKDRGFDVKGIEISRSAAEYANREYGINAEWGSLDKIRRQPRKSFDIICMWHTIEHLNRPDHILSRLKYLLKDDGIIALTTPNINSLPARKMGMFWEWVNPPKHLFLFSKETLSGLLQKQGYEVVELSTRKGDYAAFLLSFLTYPVRKRKYFNKFHNSSVRKQGTGKIPDNVNNLPAGNTLSGLRGYWNLRLKEIFGMDFLFHYPYRFKNLGPEIFIIARKS